MDEKVSTIVRFKDNRLSSMTPLPVMTEINDRSVLQRRIYLVLNAFILIVIVLPNIFDIFFENEDFPYHLLFMFHATCLLLFFISTAIFRNVGDGITTITSLTLFAIYKTIHYIIRYRHCHINSRQGFLISTIQLTVLLIFTITAILWTYLLIRKKYRKINTKKMKDYETKQKRIFYSFLALNLMLTISSLILKIRTRENFGLYHIILLSVGIPLVLLWCISGILMSIYKNCLCISSFYSLSLLQPLHLICMIFQLLNEWNDLGTKNETNQFLSLFIIIFVCVCANFLVHLLTTIVACWMISRTEKRIFNTRWMFTNMSVSIEDHNQSFNYDELEEIVSNEQNKLAASSSSCISQVQQISLSMSKPTVTTTIEESSDRNDNKSILSVKTSNIPGPVGLLPKLKTTDELQKLKDNKNAREVLPKTEEKCQVKRTKTSSDLFSLNINNYPSYAIALEQLRELVKCEPIGIATALVKARLGIKKRIPLMCAAVTHYDRLENTILLDKTGHIRATFIGDDEPLDEFNIRVGHTLVLRNVAVFTSIRHRHHYVNIHVQNIIAVQDPLANMLSMPSLTSRKYCQEETTKLIEDEIQAYSDSSKSHNETFRIFSQSDHEDDEQPPMKKLNTNNSGFQQVKPKINPMSTNKFKETIQTKQSSASVVTITSVDTDLQQQIDADLASEDLTNEFFSSW